MCGIAGFLQLNAADYSMQSAIDSMIAEITHRGPDDKGSWLDQAQGIALGHRRLSILDLSPAGHQPMLSNCGQFVIVFNGEIYNHLELRNQLNHTNQNSNWRGHSDTETLLACFATWGIERTLQSITGMFALALWDRQRRCLILARDRFGEKPLYYGNVSNGFIFSSELKSIKKYPKLNLEIDRASLPFLLRQSNIPAPYTIYKNIKKLSPGHYIQIYPENRTSYSASSKPFWSLIEMIGTCAANPFLGSAKDAIDMIEGALTKSIKQQMLSDVPIGVFLSGGIDSSTIAALMQQQSANSINTFTIGFDDSKYNEAIHAKAIAKHLGTNHTELYVTPTDALNVIPNLPTIFCEPFSDSSQIPTYLVSQLAKQHVTVALSGDGGDELLCGYTRYIIGMQQWGQIKKLPLKIRRLLATIIEIAPINFISQLTNIFNDKQQLSKIEEKINSLASILRLKSDADFYRRMTYKSSANLLANSESHQINLEIPYLASHTKDLAHWMMAMDSLNYLPNDILVKVDRAAMANGLETRIPFLSQDFAEIAWRMPLKFKIQNGKGKWLLRQILYRYVPQKLVDRPKWGFGVPLGSWIRGPLRDWAEALLNKNRLNQEGFFNAETVRYMFQEHIDGKGNNEHQLWDILMFQAWKECQ